MNINNYRFLSDKEPTDEQLEELMKEVGKEAQRRNEEATKRLRNETLRQILNIQRMESGEAK